MQPTHPSVHSCPEIDESDEPLRKKRRVEKFIHLSDLTPEMLVKIAGYLKPKDIYQIASRLNNFFNRISGTFFENSYQNWWHEHYKSEFPDSYSALSKETINSSQTIWHKMYRYEFAIRRNIVQGKHTSSFIPKFFPNLKTLSRSENLLIVSYGEFIIEGWDLSNKSTQQVFSLTTAFTTYTIHQNILYLFCGNNTIQVHNIPSDAAELHGTPLSLNNLETNREIEIITDPAPDDAPNPFPIKQAKVEWPYLFGFAEKKFTVWNLTEKPAGPTTYNIPLGQFIGFCNNQIVYFKNDKLLSKNIKTLKKKTLFSSHTFSFFNSRLKDSQLISCLQNESSNIFQLLVIDLLTKEKKFIPFNFSQKPSQTFIYDDHFYCWHLNEAKLEVFSLNTLNHTTYELKKIDWIAKTTYKKAKDKTGTPSTLLNGLIYSRKCITNLANNTLAYISTTLCPHNHYALDHTKVVYLNGLLIRGYPCTNAENNITILDFENPVETLPLPPTDPMDI